MKKSCLIDGKGSSLENPIINEKDECKVQTSHSTTLKIKYPDTASETANSDVNLNVAWEEEE